MNSDGVTCVPGYASVSRLFEFSRYSENSFLMVIGDLVGMKYVEMDLDRGRCASSYRVLEIF